MARAGAARGRRARAGARAGAGAGAGAGGRPQAPSPAIAALLARVAPLDRGLAAGPADAKAVDAAARKLEGEGPAPTLGGGGMASLAGRWQLVYTSAFADSGSLGGLRPGPPAALSPVKLGQVFQDIWQGDAAGQGWRCDNEVTLTAGLLPALGATVTLEHALRCEEPASFVIEFDRARLGGPESREGADGANGLVPALPAGFGPPQARSARFDNTYCGDGLRITRGDRGELRVYVRPDGLS